MINILLVDDNLSFRHLFRELLSESSLKFKLVEANNPIEGLEQFKNYKYSFDFIICDFFLPIQNGNDFLEVVKSHEKNIICLLISADESLNSKKFKNIDYFFAKSDSSNLVKYLENHKFP